MEHFSVVNELSLVKFNLLVPRDLNGGYISRASTDISATVGSDNNASYSVAHNEGRNTFNVEFLHKFILLLAAVRHAEPGHLSVMLSPLILSLHLTVVLVAGDVYNF